MTPKSLRRVFLSAVVQKEDTNLSNPLSLWGLKSILQKFGLKQIRQIADEHEVKLLLHILRPVNIELAYLI